MSLACRPTIHSSGIHAAIYLILVTIVALMDAMNSTSFGRQFGGQVGIAFLRTHFDHQAAHNRVRLSGNLVAGNPALLDRQDPFPTPLTGRGYQPEEAHAAAVAVIQKSLQGQVAMLSFNERVLAVALLFVFAAPILVLIKLVMGRLMPHPTPAQSY